MNVASGRYRCQIVKVCWLFKFKIHVRAACDLSTTPTVCGCFMKACDLSISRNFVSWWRSSQVGGEVPETKWVPR